MMKRVISLTAVFVLAHAGLALAQSQEQSQTQTQEAARPLAELAKDEEARRKTLRKPAKVYSNDNLKPAAAGSEPAPVAGASGARPPAAQPAEPAAEDPAASGEVRDQKYWAGRMKDARAALDRMTILSESLQSRVNALTADAANRDYPSRGVVETQRNAALAELERMKKEIEAQKKAITGIEDEARRAGVPSGWLRGA